jgi:hypothetical protein
MTARPLLAILFLIAVPACGDDDVSLADAAAAADAGSACQGSEPTCVEYTGRALDAAFFRNEDDVLVRIAISESAELCEAAAEGGPAITPDVVSLVLVAPAAAGTYEIVAVEHVYDDPPAGKAAVAFSLGELHSNVADDGAFSGTVTLESVGDTVVGSVTAQHSEAGAVSGGFSAAECDGMDFR